MRKRCFRSFFLVVLLSSLALQAHAVDIKMPFVFIDQFDANAGALGFPQNRVIQVGALINPGDTALSSVTATNLDTGEVLNPSPVKAVDKFFSEIYLVMPLPAFDPGKHLGVWDITAIDEKGNKASVKTHRLDKTDRLPFADAVEASGPALTPTIRWSALDEEGVPKGCKIGYRVRLLKSIDNQLHRSPLLKDTAYAVPEGVLKEADLSDAYIKIECSCSDTDEPASPLPLELRSGCFRHLKASLASR